MADIEITEAIDSGVSRRNFIKGVIAAGAAVGSANYMFRGVGSIFAQPTSPGAVERLITLTVNGQQRRGDVMKQETLAMTLRYKLGLTGTKLGCDRSECGACTVLLNRRPVSSCILLAVQADGEAVTTVEALERDGALSALQEAFLKHGAVQCGYCTPGFLITATALLEENPSANRDEIIDALKGNLCRCTGYKKIIEAVESVARG